MNSYVLTYIEPTTLIEYTLNDGVHWKLAPNGLAGFASLETANPGEQVPYRDGVTLVGRPYTGARKLFPTLKTSYSTHAGLKAAVQLLRRQLNPYKAESTLGALRIYDVDNDVTRQIDCRPCGFPEPDMFGPHFGLCIPMFYAPDPMWYDPAQVVESLAIAGDSGITFPIAFPITFGSTSIDGYIYPNNSGDVPTWPTIRLYGPGTDPTIENETTGKVIALTEGGGISMDAGDYIDIDMQTATVTWYDATDGSTTSIIETLSDVSEFWPLAIGGNTVHITMTDAVAGSAVFSYYLRYLSGV